MTPNIGAFILAAGLGTRLKPWTDHHPKALAMVNGKSLLQRNVQYLQQYGIFEVVVNVHHFADQIIETIAQNKGWGSNITISDETDQVLETGGGLLKARSLLEQFDNFVVLNCDILTNLNLHDFRKQHIDNQSIATVAVTHRETSRYLLFDSQNKLVGWQNIKTGEVKLPVPKVQLQDSKPMAFSGIHFIDAAIFPKIQFTGKFSMIDLYLDLCKTETIMAYDHNQDLVLDVGKPEAIFEAERLFL